MPQRRTVSTRACSFPWLVQLWITLVLPEGLKGKSQVYLLDGFGRTIALYTMEGGGGTIDVAKLAPGFYYLKIKQGEKQLSGKVLKQ